MPFTPWNVRAAGLAVPRDAWQAWMQLGSAATATWLAAAEVVALRLPMLALAGLTAGGQGSAELRRMIAEKPGAFSRSWQILAWQLATAPVRAQTAALAPIRRRAEANVRRLRA
ncbi:hypothetical protein ACFOGJ_06770 [Marinibaculum pumilum]|uniref:Uncharacterized protein n=1 Tax=Marinibaculum pumilum TaxID=1766165 RepID=A0ABV7KX70_9PROT